MLYTVTSRPVSERLLLVRCGPLLIPLALRRPALRSMCVNLTKCYQLAAGTGWSCLQSATGKASGLQMAGGLAPRVGGSIGVAPPVGLAGRRLALHVPPPPRAGASAQSSSVTSGRCS